MSLVAMTDNKLLTTIKSKPFLSGMLAFMLLAAGLTLIFSALTPADKNTIPETKLVTTNFDGSTSKLGSVIYSGKKIEVPSKLMVAQFRVDPTAAEQISQYLTSEYGLDPIPQSENILIKNQYSLFRDQKKEEFIFAVDVSQQTTTNASLSAQLDLADYQSKQIINQDRAFESAQLYIQKLLPSFSYRPIPSSAHYYSADKTHLDETQQTQADVVEFELAPFIGEYPVLFEHREYAPMKIMLDSSYRVIRLIYQFALFSTALSKEIDSISLETAIENLNNGRGSIVSAYQDAAEPLNLEVVKDVDLTQVQIEYRVDQSSGLVLPVYFFTGTAKNNAGDTMRIQLFTPAVKTLYSKE